MSYINVSTVALCNAGARFETVYGLPVTSTQGATQMSKAQLVEMARKDLEHARNGT
ncbi:MAG: hypothetical protein O3C68_07630 [Proteobacteria bacterium]|nr:hypothetical protein [Pseudomonadota bacterium]